VPGKQLRTANFSEDDRKRFGDAVSRARRKAGFRSRRAFADVAGIGKRSVDAVETYEPGVGEDVLEAIGRALGEFFSDWTEDTPRAVLEDHLVPANVTHGTVVETVPSPPIEPAPNPGQYADLEGFLQAVIVHLRSQGMPEEAILQAVARTVKKYEQTSADTERGGPDTEGGRVS
jgi:hypothetical protein